MKHFTNGVFFARDAATVRNPFTRRFPPRPFAPLSPMSEITLLLNAVAPDDPRSSEELLPLVYDELRHLAALRMGGGASARTLQPTALVHEAWLRLVHQDDRRWNNRAHFFRAAAQAMRHILVDLSRQKASLKRGNNPERVHLDDLDLSDAAPDERVLLVNEALNRLETDDPESARLVTLKFFGGFTNAEIARMLEIGERTVDRQWAYARASLFDLVRENADPAPGSASSRTESSIRPPAAGR